MVDGKRRQFAGADVKVPTGKWQELGLKIEGDRLTVLLDGEELFGATDRTFAEAGRVGLWTKADSFTHFDDLVAPAALDGTAAASDRTGSRRHAGPLEPVPDVGPAALAWSTTMHGGPDLPHPAESGEPGPEVGDRIAFTYKEQGGQKVITSFGHAKR